MAAAQGKSYPFYIGALPEKLSDWYSDTRPRSEQMWVAIEGQHRSYVDVSKLHKLAVAYVGSGNYKVVGTCGDVDVCLKSGLPNAKEATEWIDDFVKQIA